MLVHRRATPSIRFTSTRLLASLERGTSRVKCSVLFKDTTTCPQPRLKPGPPNLEIGILTIRPQPTGNFIISQIILAFWLGLAYHIGGQAHAGRWRCQHSFLCLYKASRFYVALQMLGWGRLRGRTSCLEKCKFDLCLKCLVIKAPRIQETIS